MYFINHLQTDIILCYNNNNSKLLLPNYLKTIKYILWIHYLTDPHIIAVFFSLRAQLEWYILRKIFIGYILWSMYFNIIIFFSAMLKFEFSFSYYHLPKFHTFFFFLAISLIPKSWIWVVLITTCYLVCH